MSPEMIIRIQMLIVNAQSASSFQLSLMHVPLSPLVIYVPHIHFTTAKFSCCLHTIHTVIFTS